MSKKELMWVHPDFKKKIKSEAAKEGLNILQLTKKMAMIELKEEDNGKIRF